jgi:hypothetical protein
MSEVGAGRGRALPAARPEVGLGQGFSGLFEAAEIGAPAALGSITAAGATASAVLVRLFRDIHFGGPSLEIRSGRPGYADDVLIDLDQYWRQNLSAIGLGDLGWTTVELVPTEARLPRVTGRLPMSEMPAGYNDRIGQLRLLRDRD